MVRINSFIDRKDGLQSVVGSVNITNRSILEANIAVHGLGSNVQGTFTLARGRVIGSLGTERLPRQLLGRGTIAGQLGSFASYLNISPNINLGNTSGTLALARLPRQITERGTVSGVMGSFTHTIQNMGTFLRTTLATGSNNAIQPPARWRFLSWQVSLTNSVTLRSGFAIIQMRASNGGTIAQTLIGNVIAIPTCVENMNALVSPYLGSYYLRHIGSASAGTFRSGQEWTY